MLKILTLLTLTLLSLSAHSEQLSVAEEHEVKSLNRDACRLNIPSRLIVKQDELGQKSFVVRPLRPELSASFCQNGEVIVVSDEMAHQLTFESELYTQLMTLAVYKMADANNHPNRGSLSIGDTFYKSLELEVFNYRVGDLFQGDQCTSSLEGMLNVVAFLGPQGVLVQYSNERPHNKGECPTRTIALFDQTQWGQLTNL